MEDACVPHTIDGYVADSCYPSYFHQNFQPAWTDWNLERRGLTAPRTFRVPFKLVDLGCGDGLGLLLTAASYPEGRFIGIDASPEHIARGQALVQAANLTNVELRCADFKTSLHLADASADYVTAQGVLAWVSTENRTHLLDLAERWLRPGGALTLGYNCFPGWSRVMDFQKLVHTLARPLSGTSSQRFAAALAHIRSDNMLPPDFMEWFDEQAERRPTEYLPHEYLNDHWNPCWSSDVIQELAKRGLSYAGQATPPRLRDDLYLKPNWRKTLDTIRDVPSRELFIDLQAERWYRHDIYIKSSTVSGLSIPALMQRWWRLADPSATNEYHITTHAGDIDFDNAATRAIMQQLAQGPMPLSSISTFAAPDLLNSIDAIYMAELATPVDPPGDPSAAARLNAALAAHGNPINASATAYGAIGN